MYPSDPAIIAALISGLISTMAGLISHWYHSIKNENFERRIKKENWCRDISHLADKLKEHSIKPSKRPELVISDGRIDYGKSHAEVQLMKSKVDNLVEKSNKKPKQISNDRIFREIDKLNSYFENPTSGAEQINTYTDLTEFVYQRSHNIEKYISEELN